MTYMYLCLLLVVALCCPCYISAQDNTPSNGNPLWSYIYGTPTIPQLVKQHGLLALDRALQFTGLDRPLFLPGPYTVFAPTNDAFKNIPNGLRQVLLRVRPFLKSVLTVHVTDNTLFSSDLQNNMLIPTLSGSPIRVNLYNGGNVATVNCAKVVLPDQVASNGVVHVIDKVIMQSKGPLVKTISGCPKIKSLVKAIRMADLESVLNSRGPFTLFVPMDSAFAKLPSGIVDEVMSNKTALTNVLTYHVIKGAICSAGLSSGSVNTLNGLPVNIQVTPQGVMVNNAKVILPDATASNGVIHAIDQVLIPPSNTIQDMIRYPAHMRSSR